MTVERPDTPPVMLTATRAEEGCTGCGTQATVQLHPYRGRLCPAHAELPRIPDGPYRPDFAEHLVDLHRADVAFAYLWTYLTVEAHRRFDAAIDRLAVTR